MSTMNYDEDDVNIDDLSDAKTVNYTNNVTIKTPKKSMPQLQANKIKKKYKNLKQLVFINENIRQ